MNNKCERCKKNIAMMMVQRMDAVTMKRENVRLCFSCAQELGIVNPDEILGQMEGMGLIGENGVIPANITENFLKEFDKIVQSAANSSDDEEGDEDDEYQDGYNNELMGLFGGGMYGMLNPDGDGEEEDEAEPTESTKQQNSTSQEAKEGDSGAFQEEGTGDAGTDSGATTKSKTASKDRKKLGKALNKFGENLVDKAKAGEIDRIVGRDKEVDRIVQILNRRQKNNPLLIGEPGVGKTAVAEGLAVRIVEGSVPEKLLNLEVVLLDMTAIVAGTQYRGQFEQRMKDVIQDARKHGNVVLIIDEVHNIVGAGDSSGAMNAANILKPALAKGEVQIIGATTLDEYRKHIEKDAALERRFQVVMIDEPSVEESIEILEGIKSYYEAFHKVKYPAATIEAAVKLSKRYIPDRFLPDKAIDLVDEAGSRKNLLNKGLIEQKRMTEAFDALIKEHTESSAQGDYERAAELRTEFLKLENEIKELAEQNAQVEVTEEDIAAVVEAWTKIPVQKITEEEAKKLIELEQRLHGRVISQDEAIKAVSTAVRRSRSGFKKVKKPSSFIFVGPTGVGKTELAKALASEIFGTEEALIRLDMSEYMEKHTVSKLIGSPPGYVGYDDGGQLTEVIRKRPYSVLLLDEIEKAHPDVFNMLLQILDDGRLTDSKGRTVFFENAIIIMTSNVGTSTKATSIGFSSDVKTAAKNYVMTKLREVFRPEFLNRIDGIAVFAQLSKDDLAKIFELQMAEVNRNMEDKQMHLEVSDEVKDFLLEKGYDPQYGARPLRRTIQEYLEDEMAEKYLRREIGDGDKLLAVLETKEDGERRVAIHKKKRENR